MTELRDRNTALQVSGNKSDRCDSRRVQHPCHTAVWYRNVWGVVTFVQRIVDAAWIHWCLFG